jgi:zinc D-Ala-D-Ala dipeptidase
MLRPWSSVAIHENGEPLEELPPALLRLEPHPYLALGAPYGEAACPFRLRQGLIGALLRAQEELGRRRPGWRLAIFDAWRPVAVQRFMVLHAITAECRARGIDPSGGGNEQEAERARVRAEVSRFWAPPSDDPATPPPHSTGAAVDLTLADSHGVPLAMGGSIDAIGAISEPDHYAEAARQDPGGEAALWHERRQLLAEMMASGGFVRHPNEWWHFSQGDQLWAWRLGADAAIYGRVPLAGG